MGSRALVLAGFAWLLLACQPRPAVRTILFLGHPYYWIDVGNRLDPRVEHLLSSHPFDQVWLGGDVCAKTTEVPETLDYLDRLLRFKDRSVHWAWGNHDVKYGQTDRLEEITGRPAYYLDCEEGLCVLVLNTNLLQWPNAEPDSAFCREMEAQHQLVLRLGDTLQHARQLVVVHHYGLLTNALTQERYDLDTIFNFYKPSFKVNCTEARPTFSSLWYPAFVKVRTRNIPVTFVSGDLGMRAKKFEFQTADSIWFVAAGINNSVPDAYRPPYLTNFDPDQVLIFEYDPQSARLTWHFKALNSFQ